MSLRSDVRAFVEHVARDYKVMNYLYNKRFEDFTPSKTPVYYSGPYWGSEEVVAIIEAVLGGKWITSGEHVHHFEAQFSKRFRLGHSVTVSYTHLTLPTTPYV
jgi:CDP-6-deoxy-D-xylo-4-hexulose-3-dehydrase